MVHAMWIHPEASLIVSTILVRHFVRHAFVMGFALAAELCGKTFARSAENPKTKTLWKTELNDNKGD
jgi:hypothetical protein